MCALDVGLGELEGVPEAEVYMALGGEVEDCVDGVVLDTLHDRFDGGYVALNEVEVRACVEAVRVFYCGAVVDFVERDDAVAGIFEIGSSVGVEWFVTFCIPEGQT